MQCVIMGIIAARPGCILIRVSREMSFGPNTKPASRISESREAAAISSACSTAREVSIMAQTRIEKSALMSDSRSAMADKSATLEIFGTRMPSGLALPAMVMSSIHHGVSSALMRISTSRLPKPLAATAAAIWSRAMALASGATESSRSRMMPSAGRIFAFSGPGELFVVRNVANLVPVYQPDGGAHGVSAALEYAVNVLRIRHIVVLGHAQCGGIRAFIDNIEPLSPGDFIGRWMQMFIKPGEVVEQRERESMQDFTIRIEKAAIFRSLEYLTTFP